MFFLSSSLSSFPTLSNDVVRLIGDSKLFVGVNMSVLKSMLGHLLNDRTGRSAMRYIFFFFVPALPILQAEDSLKILLVSFVAVKE